MTSLLASGGILALIVSFWGQVKNFCSRIVSLVWRTDTFRLSYSYRNSLIREILQNARRVDFGNKRYETIFSFLKNYQTHCSAVFESPANGFYLYRKSLIFVNFSKMSISYVRGLFDSEALMRRIIEREDENLKNEKGNSDTFFFVEHVQGESIKKAYSNGRSLPPPWGSSQPSGNLSSASPTGEGSGDNSFPDIVNSDILRYVRGLNFSPDDVGDFSSRPAERLYMTEEMKAIFEEMKIWKEKKQWFESKNIPHCRGVLLHGPGGTGKSQTIREVCLKNNVPLYVFDLATMNNEEFQKFFEEKSNYRAILFEDIDTIWDGRKNLFPDSVTFDRFINAISGVGDKDGKFIFITTNHLEKLDPVLFRDGRIDSVYKIGPLPEEGKKFLVEKILLDWPEEQEKMLKENPGEVTGAEFENKCIKVALRKLWEKK